MASWSWDYVLFICKEKKNIVNAIKSMKYSYQKVLLNKLLFESKRLPFIMNGTKIYCASFDEYFFDDPEALRWAKRLLREDPTLFEEKMIPFRYQYKRKNAIKAGETKVDFDMVDVDSTTISEVLEEYIVPEFNMIDTEKCQITFINA
jgi:hypothetical protein